MFWLASRPTHTLIWSQAGGSLKAELWGRCWASMPCAERALRPEYMENQEELMKTWHKQWGDCKQELVFIGQDMDREQITADLHDCLLTEAEAEDWAMGATFEDNWPVE